MPGCFQHYFSKRLQLLNISGFSVLSLASLLASPMTELGAISEKILWSNWSTRLGLGYKRL
jgi:hypothetical protein